MKRGKFIKNVLLILLLAIFVIACSSNDDINVSTTTTFVGTQPPGDFWSWTINSAAGTFTATNNTKSVDYSGSVTALTGNSAGISKLSVTATTDPGLTSLPQAAYAIQVPSTALIVAHAPFYTTPNEIQQSITPPVFATAQGSCPASDVSVNWITLPSASWCSSAGDPNPLGNGGGGCTSGDNAYGTAVISVSGSNYGINVTSYQLDGTPAPGGSFALSGCSCSNGLIQCPDAGGTVRFSFTPSGVFFVDTPDSAIAGIVQPDSNIDLNDFLLSGRTFSVVFHTALDSSQIFDTEEDCTSHGGTWIEDTCGTHATQPAYGNTDGTAFIGHPYSDIDNGVLSAQGGTISFDTASQPVPGLITGTFNDFEGGSAPIVVAVRQVNSKYVALFITHSPNATLGGGFNLLAAEK